MCYGEVLDREESIALLDLIVGPVAMPTPLATTVGMIEEAMLTAELLQGIDSGNGLIVSPPKV